MRLIDADEVKETIRHRTKLAEWQKGIIWALIDMHKTVDAVPVIRCKDCKHYDGYYCHNKWWGDGCGNYTPPIKDEDGFCDWAERKEE